MTLWLLPLLPVVAGVGIWTVGGRVAVSSGRRVLGVAGVVSLLVTLALAAWAVAADPAATHDLGAGLVLHLAAGPVAGPMAVLVAAVAAAVVAWAAVHEAAEGLARLVGLLVAFAGTMELLVLADDLLTLTAAWELVAVCSWGLIGHAHRAHDAPRAAAHAFNATRFGGLGLFLAAGAAFAATGSLEFAALEDVAGDPARHVVAAGVLVAAVSKSAQVPFAPWLFSAMAGPTSVSALLHSSTMVAAGVYALVRLHPVLDTAAWFGPAAIAIGLVTALAGGVVATLQGHAKQLLAASTSAQYGLMLVAVGAGYPVVAALHLAAHAVFKAHLFLAAGTALEAAGTPRLAEMRLGDRLRTTARLSAVGALALAAVPPLGAAWTKEEVVAAAGHTAPWLALLAVVAGGLSAAYATRFQLLAFGRPVTRTPAPVHVRPHRTETVVSGVLASASVGLAALWLPAVHEHATTLLDGRLPSGATWELIASVTVLVVAAYGTWQADRAGRLGPVPLPGRQRVLADWLGLPAATERSVVGPSLALASACARFDDRVVDGGVRAVAGAGRGLAGLLSRPTEQLVDALVRGVWRAGRWTADVGARTGEWLVDGTVEGVAALADRAGGDARRIQTGLVHHQFLVIAIGLALVVLAATLGR